jgi:hypothetical protein
MAINEGRQNRRIIENRSGNESPAQTIPKSAAYTRITIALPTFVVLVLRQRAKDRNLTVSAVIEPLIIEGVMLDEVERMVKQSPEFKRIAMEWMRNAVTRTNP